MPDGTSWQRHDPEHLPFVEITLAYYPMPLTEALTAFAQASACPFRPGCPGAIAARPMIAVILQLICCVISMIKEISLDHAAPGAWALRTRPHRALTHHVSQRHWPIACRSSPRLSASSQTPRSTYGL